MLLIFFVRNGSLKNVAVGKIKEVIISHLVNETLLLVAICSTLLL